MAELAAILLITAILTAATKSGRNLVKSAHKATGWRTPRTAMHHHSGRLGTLAGRGIAGTARAGRRTGTRAAQAGGRAARRAGQQATTTAARRWQARRGSGPGTAGTAGGTGTGTGTAGPGAGPGPEGGASQPASTPAGTGTDPAPESTPTTASAPAGAERSTTGMSTRFAINLEHPTTDGEFLESCVQLGDALKSLAGQIEEWADGLSALNLPRSVLNPLHQVSEGITDAADGATQAATAFENEFEDARDVASRGMTITGQDAA
jgi:hypothetical protein